MPPTCCRSEANKDTPGKRGASPFSSGWVQLVVGLGAILVLWLAVLPRIADQPPVQRHIEFLEQRQIDPSAMFYTELEPMAEVRARIARIRSRHPASFWRPAPSRERESLRN